MRRKPQDPNLIKRHGAFQRLGHWTWAIAMFFLLLTGLQIFNAHPVLYLGDQSGFGFDNSVLAIGAESGQGYLDVLGRRIETTGVLGQSSGTERAFPAWATIPSGIDLATGRVIHFFFAWVLVAAWTMWFAGAVFTGHFRRSLVPRITDLSALWSDVKDHVRLRFPHRRVYGPLQKLSYCAVLFGLFPLIVATGLAMSPGLNAAWPWLPEVLGGRQTARTLHFVAAFLLVGFFGVHIAMVLLAGPLNEMRAMVTGWYRLDTEDRGNG